MIGLIVTGHSHFASGMTSALKLISGSHLQKYEYVDFDDFDTTEILETKLNQAFKNLKECDGILVCCDLMGGSPFKLSTMIGVPLKNVEIIAGVNLPMLIEVNMLRQFEENVVELAEHMIEVGQSMITRYVFQMVVDEEPDDGI